ncbi:MAG: hypothetical protein JO069_17400 [Verrucomicrobia bacterium]|nr:hypothetical protein [Verrucomicrobiota bacterium]
MLHFIVPLKSRAVANNWQLASRLCERTLRSICQQTSAAFSVQLVCRERPALNFTHPALQIIEDDFPLPEPNTPSRMQDKWLKVRHGLIAAETRGPGHVMVVDADDLVHRDLARLALQNPATSGWRIALGLTYNEGERFIRLLPEFDQQCGTSAIVRLEEKDFPSDLDTQRERYFILSYGHSAIARYLRECGRPLIDLPFPGAVYIKDTGENNSGPEQRKNLGIRTRLKRLRQTRYLTPRLRAQFGLYRLDRLQTAAERS